MASPQTENGYTKIANEILDALAKTRINGEARQMLDAIIRLTYGYQQKSTKISTKKFIEFTGLGRQAVHKARKKLVDMNIITVTQKGNSYVKSYCFNKDYEQWKVLPKKVTVTQKGNRVLPKKVTGVTQKGNTYNKETSLKKFLKEKYYIALFEKFYLMYPKKVSKGQARKTWLKLKLEKPTLRLIFKHIRTKNKMDLWADKKFISHPSTWLNAQGWEDELPGKKETVEEKFMRLAEERGL